MLFFLRSPKKTPPLHSKLLSYGHTAIRLCLILFILTYSHTQILRYSQAHAQTNAPFDLGITPTSGYWHIQPGDEVTHTIIIKNEGAFTLNVSPHLVRFENDGKTGAPIFTPQAIKEVVEETPPPTQYPILNTQYPIPHTQYITILTPDINWDKSFILKPGEEKKVKLKINPPATEPQIPDNPYPILEKEHHLTVLFSGSPAFPAPNSNSTTSVSGIVGSNLIIYVSSQEKDLSKLEIAELEIPRIVDSFAPITFSILAKNSGRNATPNVGKAWISSLSNQKLTEYIFYPDMVLADSTREVRGLPAQIIEGLQDENDLLEPDELEQLTSQFSYKSPFLFGIYTITVNLGEETRAVRFVAVPYSIIIAALIAGIVFFSLKKLKKITK